MNQIAETKFDATTERILEAAWDRLSHYGLGKTTMAEIAADCGMSAANLYRYFENKNEIACACCKRSMAHIRDELAEIVRAENISATEKLKNYAVRMVELNLDRSAGKSKIGELVANMTENNQSIVLEKISWHHSLIAEILAQGNASGEFDIDDVLVTAERVYTGLVVFDVPLFADFYPLDKFRKSAESLIDLLITGIKKR